MADEMADELARLEAWMTEEGIETGSRQVGGIDYDCNWGAQAFLLTLGDGVARITGRGPGRIGGLAIALKDALDKAGAK